MNKDQLRAKTIEFQKLVNESTESEDPSFELYFDIFSQLENFISSHFGELSADDLDLLSDCQIKMLQAAAQKKAASQTDILLKLAIWRWNLGADAELDLSQNDAMILSAFRDLSRLTGVSYVRMNSDRSEP